MNLLSRLEKLEADLARSKPSPTVHLVMCGVSYGDDVPAKRAEAEAEFRRKNPDWKGPIERDGKSTICLVELVAVDAENGAPKHPDWEPYIAALDAPDNPESAAAIAAYEAANNLTRH
jgi:hypothetical protein